VVDGAGKLHVNIENTSEIVEIDAAKADRNPSCSFSPCELRLAIDIKNKPSRVQQQADGGDRHRHDESDRPPAIGGH
jgi:hypothetical protein